MFCNKCGAQIDDDAVVCVKCGVPTEKFNDSGKNGSKGLIAAGYICGFLSLLFLPPALGLAGIVIGIINLTKGQTGHGIAQILISVTCAIFGMIIGAAMMG